MRPPLPRIEGLKVLPLRFEGPEVLPFRFEGPGVLPFKFEGPEVLPFRFEGPASQGSCLSGSCIENQSVLKGSGHSPRCLLDLLGSAGTALGLLTSR